LLIAATLVRAETDSVTIVVAADGLSKRDVFRLPDPFAVITVDAEQTHTTSVIKKTLNPYWNESFDMCVLVFLGEGSGPLKLHFSHLTSSTVKDSSVVAVQIFDQRKFKRRDQGFLGVVNVRVSDVLDLELGGHGKRPAAMYFPAYPMNSNFSRNADAGSEKVQ
jgi:E3 ubiquitin-protein ligase NEDD4